MRKINVLIFIAICFLILNLTMLFMLWKSNHSDADRPFNSEPMDRKEGRGRGPGDFIIRELKFDSEQQEQFEMLRNYHHDSMIVLRNSMRKLKQQLYSYKSNKNENERLIIINQITSLQTKIELLTYDHFEKVRNICSKEQQQQFDRIIDDVIKRMDPVMNGRPPGPPPKE